MKQREIWKPLGTAALLLLVVSLFFWRGILRDEAFAFRDAAHYYYPLFRWCDDQWDAGRLPLWNPLENGGEPLVSNATASLFYPGKLIFALPGLSFAKQLVWYTVAHVLLAAAGAHHLARRFRLSRTAAALAAITYACSGSVMFQYCNVVFLVGAAWLPWALVEVDVILGPCSAADYRRRWRAVGKLGAILALMTLGGDPQSAYHIGLLAIGYAWLQWRSRRRGWKAIENPKPLVSGRRRIPFDSPLTRLAAAAFVGLALAAVQIVPAASWSQTSDRAAYVWPRSLSEVTAEALAVRTAEPPPSTPRATDSSSHSGDSFWSRVRLGLLGDPVSGTHHEHIYHFSVGPWRFVEFVWPNLGGRLFPENRRWMAAIPADGRLWAPTLYLGLLTALLASASARWRRAASLGSLRRQWLTWMIGLSVAGSLGWYGLGWLVDELRFAIGHDASEPWLGSPVGGLYWLAVTLLPGYAYFRYPAKLLTIASLGLSLLAAYGLDASSRLATVRRLVVRRSLGIALVSLMAIAGVVTFRGKLLAWFASAPIDEYFGPLDESGAWRDIVAALLHGLLLSALAAWWYRGDFGRRLLGFPARWPCAWWPCRGRDVCRRRIGGVAVLLVTALDLLVANGWTVVTAPTELWREPSPLLSQAESLLLRTDEASASLPIRQSRAVRISALDEWKEPQHRNKSESPVARVATVLRWERATWMPKFGMLDGVASIESYGTMMNADYAAVIRVARRHGVSKDRSVRELHPAVLAAWGTAVRVANQDGSEVSLEPLPNSLPRAWIVRQIETLEPPRDRRWQSLRAITERAWFPEGRPRDFRNSAVVELPNEVVPPWKTRVADEALPSSLPLTSPDKLRANESRETCRVSRYEPTHVVIDAELDRPGLLVLSDLPWPGWQAEIDGQAAPIWRTNRVMRGVWLSAGKHRVEMRFRPRSLAVTGTISMLGWLMLTGALIATRRRQTSAGSSHTGG
ncbi:MAG: YfhO family protein [Planctomycetales bacterium]|nr:YfhO family protein [Planctomycetales bacterium]